MSQDREGVHRLGKRELGPYAFEERMPDRIAEIVKTESRKNKTAGIIPKLAELLEQDREVDVAYLCHHSAIQISKLNGEGNFCAYRNIQMLLPESHATYSIPELQAMIEKGWDEGFNPDGRIETGGILDTRKYIGTSEAEVLLRTLNVPCKASSFGPGDNAWKSLLDSVQEYFAEDTTPLSTSGRIHVTARNPLFLQRPSHSLTVIGVERDRKGRRRLLVFDPAYQSALALRKPSTSLIKSALVRRLILFQYRRDERYLKRYSQFETLSLIDPG